MLIKSDRQNYIKDISLSKNAILKNWIFLKKRFHKFCQNKKVTLQIFLDAKCNEIKKNLCFSFEAKNERKTPKIVKTIPKS